jgi:transposase-like protein
MRSHGGEPRKIVTDKLRSYGVAHRELMPAIIEISEQLHLMIGQQQWPENIGWICSDRRS